jgi:probable H4MPT-linked C1 transfer pathway protein
MTSVIGWDIGGANLKAARAEGGRIVSVTQVLCTPHQGLAHLEQAIREAAQSLGAAERHAVTMTAELSDAFENRERGVVAIATIFAREIPAPDTLFYAGAQGFVAQAQALEAAYAIASANWRASAELVARAAPEALFIDMGSTTTDLVPIRTGAVAAFGVSDAERLACGELVYTGFTRGSPLAGVAQAPLAGLWSPLAHENFASMADVRRVLGALADDADLAPTADGRAKTFEASAARLARLAGRDARDASADDWRAFADYLARAQRRLIEDAIALLRSRSALTPDAPLVGAGVGRSVVARIARDADIAYRDLADFIAATPQAKQAAADCAPAAALALLAST